jgi:transcriptional regulator with XRE-family HTH domain
MSDMIRSSSRSRRTPLFQRQAWGHLFGNFLRGAREERGRSVEAAARAAGMEVAAWEAVEAGQVPETWEQVRRMADGLGVDRMGLTPLVLFCHEAWN